MNGGWHRAGAWLALCCPLFVAHLRCEAQANLVPNAGFEETDTCSYGLGLGELHDWHSANGSPDHLQSCQPYGTANGLPLNLFTFQQPFEGNSCVGLFTYHQNGLDEQREWIQAPLIEPLVPGQTYHCSFRANAGFGGNAQYPQIWLANDKVGMLFTTYVQVSYQGQTFPARPNHAHIFYPRILSDTVGWTLVSGSFVADSAYQYVMVGQFFTNALTDTLHFAPQGSPWEWFPRAYTLIDAVCVSASPDGCDLGQGIAEDGAGVAGIFPNPARNDLVVALADGAQAAVYDGLGREVWHGRIIGNRRALDVGSWPRGAYLLRMVRGTRVEAFKFILID